jgi:hypothetical protein
LHGFWWLGSHVEKKVDEKEELKVESHESREWPSWFKAEMAGKIEMLRNKRKIVIALLDIMRSVLSTTVLSHLIIAHQSLKFLFVFFYDSRILKCPYFIPHLLT